MNRYANKDKRCNDCIHDKVCNMWAIDSGIPFVNAITCEHYTADVVPKSEVDQWYHEYHAIKDELKQEKMYHRETEKLADKYCAELQTVKAEVAREIFEELERIGLVLPYEDYAELKKKYTEGCDD